jgi:hypothetical protein
MPSDAAKKARTCETKCCRTMSGRRETRDQTYALVVVEPVLPIVQILRQVHLFGGPEGSLGPLVGLPDLVVLDGEEDKSLGVLLQQRL